MALASGPSVGTRDRDAAGIPLRDVIRVDPAWGPAAGVIAVLADFPAADPSAYVGRAVRVHAPNAPARAATVADVRDHGPTISLFLPGLTKADVPLDARVEILPA